MSNSILQNGHIVSNGAEVSAHHRSTLPSGRVTPDDLAVQWQLNLNPNGKWSGPHPIDRAHASKDGFTLCPEGNAFTNRGEKYTSRQVADMAGLRPGQYSPLADWKERHGTTPAPTGKRSGVPFEWSRAQLFDYHDEGGELLFQVGRLGDGEAKQIRQRCPDGRGGWRYSLEGVRRVLYRLPEVLNAQTVFICEGEKAAAALNDAFERAGLLGEYVATTNAQGAGKWQDDFCESLDGAAVVVLPDFDEPGDKHSTAVCASIYASEKALSLCRVDLPDLPSKGDAYDWLASGRTIEQLLSISEETPQWEPTPEPPKEKRFPLLTLAQLKAKPKPKFLIHGFLVKEDTSLLTAKHASFKSFVALAMGLCVACDIPFYGHEVSAGLVVYIAAEGATGLTKRAQAWCAHHDVDPGENFVVFNSPLQIHEPGIRAAFIEEIAELKPVLIIIDTLARCAIGLEENSSKDMGEFAAALDALAKESGAHVMTVHHNNKGGEYRGSSAIPAAVGTHLSLERSGDTVTLKTEKQKDAEELQDLVFSKVEVSIPGTFGEESSLVFEKVDTRPGGQFTLGAMADKVLEEFKGTFKEEGATFSQLEKVCAEIGIKDRTFKRALNELRDKKKIICPDGRGKRGARYFLPEYVNQSTSNIEGGEGASRGQVPLPPTLSTEGGKGAPTLKGCPPCPPLTFERENEVLTQDADTSKKSRAVTKNKQSTASSGEAGASSSASYSPLFERDPLMAAKVEELAKAHPPTRCTACGKPSKTGAYHLTLEGDSLRAECAQCVALLSDAPLVDESEESAGGAA